MPAEHWRLGLPAGLLLVASLLPGEAMELNRQAVAEGQFWRLWTGQFCHWSVLHLAGNLAAAVAICVIAGRPIRPWLSVLPVVAPLLSLFLLVAVPGLERYRGLSGLVAMLVVGAAIEGGLVGRILAVAYLAKLGFDAFTGSQSALLPEGIAVAWPAHLGGLLLGLATAGWLHVRRNPR